MTSKQKFLPEKLKFNSSLHSGSLIECQIRHIARKILRAVCALPQQPNGALQNYSMLRPGYHRKRFLNAKCTFGIHRTYCHSICTEKIGKHWIYASRKCTIMAITVKWMDKRTYVSLIHMTIVTTLYWISLLRPSPVICQLWLCFHALHGLMPVINKPHTRCVKLKMTPPSFHTSYANYACLLSYHFVYLS